MKVRCFTVFRIWEQVHYCSQAKETWAVIFSGERNRCIYTGTPLFSGEGNRCSNVFRKRELGALPTVLRRRKVLFCRLYLGDGKKCPTVFRRRDLVLYCSQEKETSVLLLSGEGNMRSMFLGDENIYTTVIRKRKLMLYCFRRRDLALYCSLQTGALQTRVLKENETGALLLMFSGERDWCSTVPGKGQWGCTYRFYRFYLYKFHMIILRKVCNQKKTWSQAVYCLNLFLGRF